MLIIVPIRARWAIGFCFSFLSNCLPTIRVSKAFYFYYFGLDEYLDINLKSDLVLVKRNGIG